MVLGDVTLQLLSWQNDSCRDWVEWALSLSLSLYIYIYIMKIESYILEEKVHTF